MSERSVNRVLESAVYIMEYKKFLKDGKIYYTFYKPRDVKVKELDLGDVSEEYLNNFLKMQYNLFFDDFYEVKDTSDINKLDVLCETDPLVYRTESKQNIRYLGREELKAALRKKFGVKALKPSEEFNTDVLLGIADPIIALQNRDEPDQKTTITPQKTELQKTESLEAFLKRTKKVTRFCLKFGCGNKIETYRSDMKRGKGFFCHKDHAREYTHVERVNNMCNTCKFEYSTIEPEDFCCLECEEFYRKNVSINQESKKNQENV